MKILLTGDVHIGRRSTRLPHGVETHRHSCSAAWARIVDLALAERVDLVAISGDLVDQANRYLEAIGPLERGLERLARAGIAVVAVAGNHDHNVLPALVDSLGSDSIRLLGRGGVWERFTFTAGGDRVHVDGWSFPRGAYEDSPVRTYAPDRDGGPILALVHADLDQPGSRYAPVALPELRRHPDVLFLLGHIHAPRIVREPGGANLVYPGSPQAMDPGERGEHGVVLLRITGTEVLADRVPVSTVRYETVDVPVTGIENPEDVDRRVFDAVRRELSTMAGEVDRLECARFRLRLVGATRVARAIEARLAELTNEFELIEGGISATIESVSLETTTEHDLDAIAAGIGAPALLADILRTDELDPALVAEVDRIVDAIHGSRSFMEIADLDEEDHVGVLRAAAHAEVRRAAAVLLDELLLQKREDAS